MENLKLKMWSPSTSNIDRIDIFLDHARIEKGVPKFEPNPYTFTKIENGKKTTADSSFIPPSWLLLDHTIAVIWSLFSLNPTLQQLSIDDLKWAYEFLKRIKNKKGENPPDVKVCLKEIQDRLINLYAKLTSLKEGEPCLPTFSRTRKTEDFDEIAAAFGEKIIADSNTSYFNTTIMTKKYEDLSPVTSSTQLPPALRVSSRDLTKSGTPNRITNSSKKSVSEDYSEGTETGEDDEVEKYVLSLFENDKKEDPLQKKPSMKSLIPMKKKNPPPMVSELLSTHTSQDTGFEGTKKDKCSKRVHCFAEMRSLKFQKSMKVKDTNGEEAAYSNLKAEIQRLTFNPKVSKGEVMKFLKEWRSEQVDRLHNELKRLSSIEEFMKDLHQEEVAPKNSPGLNELGMEKCAYF